MRNVRRHIAWEGRRHIAWEKHGTVLIYCQTVFMILQFEQWFCEWLGRRLPGRHIRLGPVVWVESKYSEGQA
jgi:hypothetical protein